MLDVSNMIIWVYGRILLVVIAFIFLFWLIDRMQVNREKKRLRAQRLALHEAIERARRNGWVTVNEVREYGDRFWTNYEEDYRREFE